MDSGTISQLVFFVFGAAVLLYGFILHRDLARLRDSTDRAQAKLNASVQTGITEAPLRISTEVESFNQAARQYNARIGQFPEAIVAAIMGMQRRPLFRMSETEEKKTGPNSAV
jgi:hypothetical protein